MGNGAWGDVRPRLTALPLSVCVRRSLLCVDRTCEAPMRDLLLDSDEQELLDAYEAGEFDSELTEERRAYLVDAARESVRRDQPIATLLSRQG